MKIPQTACPIALVIFCCTDLSAATEKTMDSPHNYKIMSDADYVGGGGKYDRDLLGRWCWDVLGGKGGLVENGKIIIQKCKVDKKTQDFFLGWYSLQPGHGNSESFAISTRIRPDLCVGVKTEKEKAWLRLEQCSNNPPSAKQSWAMDGDMCAPMIAENNEKASWEIDENDKFFVTTQGTHPRRGAPVMLRNSQHSRNKYFGNSIGKWCVENIYSDNGISGETEDGDEWDCSLTEVSSSCEASVAGIGSVQRMDAVNVNAYFDHLDRLSLPNDKVLDDYYFADGMGGHPVLYVRSKGDDTFSNSSASAVAEEVFYNFGSGEYSDWLKHQDFCETHGYPNGCPLWHSGCPTNTCPAYLDEIIVEDNPQGYMQLASLSILGDHFALWWHSGYKDDAIICSEVALERILSRGYSDQGQYPVPLDLELARAIDVTPTVECSEDKKTVRLKLTLFTFLGGGLYRLTYNIARHDSSLHNIIDTEKEVLVPFDSGIMI